MKSDPLDKYMHDVAANIRRIRIEKGLTQVDLANLIGVEKQYINRVERGIPLTLRTIISISLALKKPLHEILKSDRLPTLHNLISKKRNP